MAFGTDPPARVVPEQDLDPVPPRVGEDEQVSRKGSRLSELRTTPASVSNDLRRSMVPAARYTRVLDMKLSTGPTGPKAHLPNRTRSQEEPAASNRSRRLLQMEIARHVDFDYFCEHILVCLHAFIYRQQAFVFALHPN